MHRICCYFILKLLHRTTEMGKKKTTNRGRKPAAVGEYKDLSDDQKRSYHKNAMRKHRGLHQ